jgi:hypothetical protein
MDYSVVAMTEEGLGHYAIAAMFAKEVDSVEFIMAYEQAMKDSNEEFRVVRETGALGATRLYKLQTSAFDTRIHEYHSQAKPVVLTRDPSVLRLCEEATA